MSLEEVGARIRSKLVTLSSIRGTTYWILVSSVPKKMQVDDAAKSEVGDAGSAKVLEIEKSLVFRTQIELAEATAKT